METQIAATCLGLAYILTHSNGYIPRSFAVYTDRYGHLKWPDKRRFIYGLLRVKVERPFKVSSRLVSFRFISFRLVKRLRSGPKGVKKGG